MSKVFRQHHGESQWPRPAETPYAENGTYGVVGGRGLVTPSYPIGGAVFARAAKRPAGRFAELQTPGRDRKGRCIGERQARQGARSFGLRRGKEKMRWTRKNRPLSIK